MQFRELDKVIPILLPELHQYLTVQVLLDISYKRLDSAKDWVSTFEAKLRAMDSELPFLLHKTSFCFLLEKAK